LQELQRRLHLPIGDSSHRHHKGKEDDPEENPKKPPKPMHSQKVVVHGYLLTVLVIVSRLAQMIYEMSSWGSASFM
jgi:hypothetical protein